MLLQKKLMELNCLKTSNWNYACDVCQWHRAVLSTIDIILMNYFVCVLTVAR